MKEPLEVDDLESGLEIEKVSLEEEVSSKVESVRVEDGVGGIFGCFYEGEGWVGVLIG